jgi:hypothetical protein
MYFIFSNGSIPSPSESLTDPPSRFAVYSISSEAIPLALHLEEVVVKEKASQLDILLLDPQDGKLALLLLSLSHFDSADDWRRRRKGWWEEG